MLTTLAAKTASKPSRRILADEPCSIPPTQCRCGAVKMRVKKPPITRFYCHCNICQEVYRRDFGDPTVVWSFNIEIEDISKIDFKRQRLVPISVKCGTCKVCEEPVVGSTAILPVLSISYIPAALYQDPAEVPNAAGHIF